MTAFPLPTWTLPTSETLGEFMIHFLWLGGVVWCLGWLARSVVRGSAEVRYLLSALTMTLLVAATVPAGLLASHSDLAFGLESEGSPEWLDRWRDTVIPLFPLAWYAGTLGWSTAVVAGLFGVRRLSRTPLATPPGVVVECWERLAGTLRVSSRVSVAICDGVRLPFVVGIVRPVVLLPVAALGWSRRQCELILLHELAHVRRYDNLVTIVQRIVEAVLWFHPAVWSTSRWLDEDREFCCDDFVLAMTRRPDEYARCLMDLSHVAVAPCVLASSFGQKPLTVRVRRILTLQEPSMFRPRVRDLLSASLCCLVCGVCLVDLTLRAEPTRPIVASTVEAQPAAPRPEPLVTPPVPQALPSPPSQSKGPQSVKELVALQPVKRNWGPEQVIGAPDTAEAGDQVTAWASLSPDDAEEWLICEYEKPVSLKSVRVHETYNPGALVKVTVFDPAGVEHLAWEGEDPTPPDQPRGVSVFPVKLGFKTQKIKVDIDSVGVPGWNEIDAIGLRDSDGATSWAVNVEASSTYAVQGMPTSEPVSTIMVTVPAEELLKFQQQFEELNKQVAELKLMQQDLREIKELLQKRRNKSKKAQ